MNDKVVCHELVIGELACGNFRNRKKVIGLLQDLPKLPHIQFDDFLYFVEEKELCGKGIGYVDIHLLASAKISQVTLWTLDKRLEKQAKNSIWSFNHKQTNNNTECTGRLKPPVDSVLLY